MKNAWIVGLTAQALVACVAGAPNEETDSSEEAIASCDEAKLEICRRNGGGDACRAKWCATGSSRAAPASSTGTGERLASLALRRDGYGAGGRCYEHVYYAIRDANITTQAVLDQYDVGYGGAWDFARLGESNPAAMARVGFVKSSVSPSQAPRGSVLVWRPGQCGYSSEYGHIEIAVGGGRACSDFCGPIATGCGAPLVYVPAR